MTDLEMTRLCAEAMGFHTGRPAALIVAYKVNDCAIIAGNNQGGESVYDPLHDDAQAMAMVKHLRLHINDMQDGNTRAWGVFYAAGDGLNVWGRDLNRAIVECVAKIEGAK